MPHLHVYRKKHKGFFTLRLKKTIIIYKVEKKI